MRVLVADDSRDAADTLAFLLQRRGHEVQVAYDGLSALAAARRFRPQVALLDVQMPRMHGGDVARHLRRQAGPGGVLVVAVSATDPEDSRLARYDGVFDDFLSKPYDPDRLEELLAVGCSAAAS
jgi:CheY-like chemotaxis protein